VEIESYLVELLQREQADNAEFRDEVRRDFQEFREWMAVHKSEHDSGKQLKSYLYAGLGVLLTLASTVASIIAIWRH
jgi:hypothetical protein